MCYVQRARHRMRMERQKELYGENGNEQSATALVGHGMRYVEDEKDDNGGGGGKLKKKSATSKNKKKGEGGGRKSRARSSLFGRRSLKAQASLNRKNKVNDTDSSSEVMNGKVNKQYDAQRLLDGEEHNGDDDSYYSDKEEEEEEEILSSMEDSYYSEEESDYSSGSSYSEE